jgi:1-acyl-sn-glycerol-3-phosphate acyltransferase
VRIALESGAPILPVTVRGANRVWSQTMNCPHFPKVDIFYHPLFRARRRHRLGFARLFKVTA